jgi:hypothetical protein
MFLFMGGKWPLAGAPQVADFLGAALLGAWK